jgi:hypothetical protein
VIHVYIRLNPLYTALIAAVLAVARINVGGLYNYARLHQIDTVYEFSCTIVLHVRCVMSGAVRSFTLSAKKWNQKNW